MTDKLYSVADAAKYLGLSRQGVKWHVYQTRLLRGQLLGKTLVFTQDELDHFKTLDIKPGRKPKRHE